MSIYPSPTGMLLNIHELPISYPFYLIGFNSV
jgi:hypothetical protein